MVKDKTEEQTKLQPEAEEEIEAGVEAVSEEGELDQWRDRALRLQAELENQRKRFDRELTASRRYGLEEFARELLPVKDSLEHGLTAAIQDHDPGKLQEGMELTLKMIADMMAKFGIQEIDPIGERFDPQFHEAMSMQPSDTFEPNTVLTVFQKGYLLEDRLLRPARVVVAGGGEEQKSGTKQKHKQTKS